jgi:translocator protein
LRPGRAALGLLGWLAVTFGAAALGAIASSGAGTFYGELSRPAWAPAGSLFAPVWSALYLLMAVAAWLVWRERGFRGAGAALMLYLVQLVANALWTWLFFVARQGALAFVETLLLWALIAATTVVFWRTRPLAGALLLPYLGWVTFAAALTYSVWQRNPALLS